jgi:hypothetical protein
MILADVGSRALKAHVICGTVVVGESAWQRSRTVIVIEADLVRQPIEVHVVMKMANVMVMVVRSGLRHPGRKGEGSQHQGCGQLEMGHCGSPKKA